MIIMLCISFEKIIFMGRIMVGFLGLEGWWRVELIAWMMGACEVWTLLGLETACDD
jgi:hypothetical protein